MIDEKGLLGRYRFRSQCLKKTTHEDIWYYESSAFAREITKYNALNPKLDWIIYVDCSERTFEDRLILAAIQVVLYIVSILKFPFKASIFLKPFTYSFPPSCKYMEENRISFTAKSSPTLLDAFHIDLVPIGGKVWKTLGVVRQIRHLELYISLLSRWTNMLRYARDLLDELLTAVRGTTLPNFSLTRRK